MFGALLHQLAGYLCAQPRAGPRSVRHIDAVDAVFTAQRGTGYLFDCVNAARRQNLDKGDELARRQLRSQLDFSARGSSACRLLSGFASSRPLTRSGLAWKRGLQ